MKPNMPSVVKNLPGNVASVATGGYEHTMIAATGAHAAQTEWRARNAEGTAQEAEQTQRFAKNLGHIAAERLVDVDYEAPEHPAPGLAPEAVLVRAQTKKEIRMDAKMERKLQRHVRASVKQSRAEAVAAASKGRVNIKETKRARAEMGDQMRQARKDGIITADEMSRGLREGVMVTVRDEHASVEKTSGKTSKTAKRVINYAEKVERKSTEKAIGTRKRANNLQRKAVKRRTAQIERKTKRTARRSRP